MSLPTISGIQPSTLALIATRVRNVNEKSIRLGALRDHLTRQHQEYSDALQRNSAEHALLEKVVSLFNFLIDRLIHQNTTPLTDLVTRGFRAIFQDQDLEFGYDTSIKRDNVSVDFFIRNGTVKGRPLGSFGQGPSVIADLLLRVLVLMRMKRERFILLDESLKAVSSDYIENTATFLRELSRESGIDILLVTHTDKQTFAEGAEKVLVAKNSTPEGPLVTMTMTETPGSKS